MDKWEEIHAEFCYKITEWAESSHEVRERNGESGP